MKEPRTICHWMGRYIKSNIVLFSIFITTIFAYFHHFHSYYYIFAKQRSKPKDTIARPPVPKTNKLCGLPGRV